MNKPVSIALVIIGVILLVYGISAGDSIASTVKESVSGTPTDKSLYLIIGGVLSLVIGGVGLFRGRA